MALGRLFEISSYMNLVTGVPSLMASPGRHEPYVYAGPLSGVFVIIGGLAGALIGSLIGKKICSERTPKSDKGMSSNKAN
ncbi:MAG TPA: hypothetical protein VN915_13960 [Elusimicrobiota bacterium]|nr:hypothetical protein [Elusimicrobiota bacterium]